MCKDIVKDVELTNISTNWSSQQGDIKYDICDMRQTCSQTQKKRLTDIVTWYSGSSHSS